MARPPLVLESYGKISRRRIDGVPTAFARYRDADGKTRKVQRVGKSLSDAEQNLVLALTTRQKPIDESDVLSRDSTIDQLIGEWLTEARAAGSYAKATLRTYSQRASFCITPGIGQVRLREASVPLLDRFVKLTIKNHGPGTARTARTILVNAFSLAVRHGLVDLNLAKSTAPVPVTKSTPDAPSLETCIRMLAFLQTHDAAIEEAGREAYLYDLTAMYVATGARTAEVLAAEWTAVDFDRSPMSLDINGTLIVNEEGKLERQGYTKSEAGMRTLLLPPSAGDILHRRRIKSYNNIVFPSANGKFRWPHNVREDWRKAIQNTEFEGITPKGFRKAVATLLRDEVGIERARDQLGHSDERVTEKHYAKRLAEAPDSSAELEKFFS